MEDGTSLTRIKVRGYHADMFGVVNHARYLQFFEEARWNYLDLRPELRKGIVQSGLGHAVVSLGVDYKKPVRPGELLLIETGVARAGERGITFAQEAYVEPDREAAATGEIVVVFFDSKTKVLAGVDHEAFAPWPELGRAVQKGRGVKGIRSRRLG